MAIEHMEALVAVAETGTLLGAAERLKTSRGRVRRKLEWLEAEAGTPLLIRSRDGVTLTPAGESLARRGRELMSEAALLLAHVKEVGTAPSGLLKVAIPTGPVPEVLVQVFKLVSGLLPDVRTELFLVERPTELLPARAEMAVTFEETFPPTCTAFEVARFPLRLLATMAYLREKGTPRTFAELHKHDLVAWRPPHGDPRAWPTSDGTVLHVEPRLISDDVNLLRRAAEDGQCLAFIPDQPQPTTVELVSVLDGRLGRDVVLRLVVPHAFSDIPRVRMLLEAARSVVDPH